MSKLEIQKEIVTALEAVGHLEEAEQLRIEWSTVTDDEAKETRSVLVYILAQTLEQKLCSRKQFPCASCVLTAKTLADVVTALGEKMAIHTFINVAKERNIISMIRHSFKFAVNSIRKKLLSETSKLTWGKTILPIFSSIPKQDSLLEGEWHPTSQESSPKIVRISEQDGT